MTFDAHRLRESIEAIGDTLPSRFVIGFSGGMDSSVLLHALAHAGLGPALLAVHVNHGLHADADRWEREAAAFARRVGVRFHAVAADVDLDAGRGPEAAARDARYAAFRECLEAGDWLLLAHHRDDQAETLLLNLLRGSGPLGLAGMPAIRPLGEGALFRPLLEVDRAELRDYAERHALAWIGDPSNDDPGMDRNFLRHRIVPALRERWPDVAGRLARSAALQADAQALLDELADADLAVASDGDPARIRLDVLSALGASRQRNLLRHACRLARLPRPPAQRLATLLDTLLTAAPDAEPRVAWPGAEARRYRGELFLLAEALMYGPEFGGVLTAARPVDLGAGYGRLSLRRTDGDGIPAEAAERGLRVVERRGGECIRIGAGGRSQKLKKLYQAAGILPWMRDSLPLLMDGDRLVAVADRWVSADIATTPGYRVVWSDPPAVD